MIQYIWSIYDLFHLLGDEMLWCISRCWQSWCSHHGTLYSQCTEMINSRPILPVPPVDLISLPASRFQRRGVCLCSCLPCYSSTRLCWPPPPPLLTGSGVRQAFTPRHDYFPLPPSFFSHPAFTALRAYTAPSSQQRRLTYLPVSLLIQKTSKQMRSSPVQRCRPAAHASCQETPHTCWLCTFPVKERQM